MGDDLVLDERECARTPMQWTSERHGGFSRAERTVRPVIDDAEYGYKKVNVADQRREPQSLLNWCERRIRMRKECPELGWGDFSVLRTETPDVLVLRYDFRGVSMLTLHNFSNRPKTVVVDPKVKGGNVLTDVFDENHSRTENGTHEMKLPPYGHRWMRVGAIDNTLNRAPF
jgi:maltose alpha-D-glucosyltransferase/alpha-amylase